MAESNPDIHTLINQMIEGHTSSESLDKAGLLSVFKDIFSNKDSAHEVMSAFDMRFESDDMEHKLEYARMIYDEAVRKNAPDIVIKSVASYIFRMTPVIQGVNSIAATGETGNPVYGVASPSSNMPFRWVSVKRSTKKPPRRTDVLLCGYWYAGVIEYGVGCWDGMKWVCPFDNNPSMKFTVLYWCKLPEAPTTAEEEVAE